MDDPYLILFCLGLAMLVGGIIGYHKGYDRAERCWRFRDDTRPIDRD